MSALPTARKVALLLVINAHVYAREKGRDDASGYRFTIRTFEIVTNRVRFHESFMISLEDELIKLGWHFVRGLGGEFAIFPWRRSQQWPGLNSKRIREHLDIDEDRLTEMLTELEPPPPTDSDEE